MGNLFTEVMGNILTTLLGNVLTELVGKVLDIYTNRDISYVPGWIGWSGAWDRWRRVP